MTNKPMLSVGLRAVLSMILNALDRDCEDGKLVRGEMAQELRAILDKTACIKCNDTVEADSGGVQPWGEGINIPCDCVLAANQQGKPVAWVNDQQLLLCSQSPREVWPENPMVHNLPRNIAGSALRTDYCNTPLFAGDPTHEECTSCDGSGEHIDAIGDWRGYRKCPAGVAAKNRTYPVSPVAVVIPERDVLRDLIAEAIGGDTYDCTRVWSAWGVGTMSEDDFVSVVEQDERLYEIADSVLAELARLNGAKP